MLVMTAKVNKKKILLALGAAALLIVGLMMMLGGNHEAEPTAAPSFASNEGRVKFLTDQGWEVVASPTESGQVRIPKETTDVYERYNALQKSQGYDLSKFAGKTVMRYVYAVKNYPGATEPVYATLLIYKNELIGGDITNSAAGGKVQGFAMPKKAPHPETIPETSAPAESEAPAST